MPINLVPQDYQQVGDTKGRRKKVRPDNLNSGTLYGQYQLRGSILTIKDSMDAVSGYMAFGTDMTTIPTGASAGTGIYIDYTGIYGLASNVQQAYMRASDGKIVAGAGAVTLDVNGITLALNNSNPNFIKWGGDSGALFGSAIGAYITANTYYTRLHSIGGDVTNHAGTLHLYAQDAVSTKSAAIDLIGNTSNGFIQIYSTDGIMVGATGAPLATLDVNGTVKISSDLTVDTNTFYVDATNNRVGIGTASPVSQLDVSDGTRHLWVASRSSAAGTGLAAGTDIASYGHILNLAGDIAGGGSSGGVNLAYYTGVDWNIAVKVRNQGGLELMPDAGKGVVIGAPTGGDKGGGTLNVATNIYKNNTAYTNPDYALEYWATGKIEKYAESERARDYSRMTLAELEAHIREHYRLPRITDAPAGIFDMADIALEKIEELFTHVIELNHRIAQLETRN